MALLKDTLLQGGVPVSKAYWAIKAARYNELNGTLAYFLVGWRNADVRKQYKLAKAAHAKALADLAALTVKFSGKVGTNETLEQTTARVNGETEKNIAAARVAQAVQIFAAYQPILAPEEVKVPDHLVQSMLAQDGLNVDYAKLFEYQKSRPGWEDAEDVLDMDNILG